MVGQPALAAQSLAPHVERMKITELRVVRLKFVKEVGSLEPAWNPGGTVSFRVGGGSFLEIRTDKGLTGESGRRSTQLCCPPLKRNW